ncbi:MAG: Fe-S protein assembly co-chaperone HscB [Polyangiaceae bacterium]|nr:Fe-S protein assembly co-chaperone HscB [Polyangiaceae bacterium]
MADAFDTLELQPEYDLDLGAVEALHRELSRTLHPDRHAGKPAAERRAALSRAIEVNEAWRALRDPVRRAEVLLTRHGVPVGENREPVGDPALLMEMMEQREALAEARAARDLPAVRRLATEMRARDAAVQSALALGFVEFMGATSGATVDPAVRRDELLRKLGELRYVRRFLEEVGEIEDLLG